MEKSHVGLGYAVCPVCACEHDEVVLLHKRLAKKLDHKNFMGWELCKPCQEKKDDDYIALVGIDEDLSPKPFKPESVYRTGAVAHLKRSAFEDLFNVPVPDNDANMCFVDNEVIEMLQKIPVAS